MLDVLNIIERVGNVKKFSNLSIEEIKNIRKALKLINNFNHNINKYGEHIFESEYQLSTKELKEKLPKKDFDNLKLNKSGNNEYVYCYKNKKLYNFQFKQGWIMGAMSLNNNKYYFDDENRLVVIITWSTQEARFDHVPWINRKRVITIDLENREVISDIGDSFTDLR
jgi:hypothetical protein